MFTRETKKRLNVKPDFLGIGAMKSGTTWISEVLRANPDIFIAHGKELHYFSWGYDCGIDSYLDNFKGSYKYKVAGEFSVSYMMNNDIVAKRIYDFNPKMKIIVALRNPIERAFSEYRWYLKKRQAMPSFQEVLEQVPGLVGKGLYYKKMIPFWGLFSDDQINIILY